MSEQHPLIDEMLDRQNLAISDAKTLSLVIDMADRDQKNDLFLLALENMQTKLANILEFNRIVHNCHIEAKRQPNDGNYIGLSGEQG